MLEFIKDREIYEKVICGWIPEAKRFLWLATADLKDLHVDKRGRMVPFLEVLSDLVRNRVEIRLLHAKEPGVRFRRDFDKYPNLTNGMEMMLCPRVHIKSAVIDGQFAYTGSANLTGAGMGAKSAVRRNFETGIVTDDKKIVEQIMKQINDIWVGQHCLQCGRKRYCASYKDLNR